MTKDDLIQFIKEQTVPWTVNDMKKHFDCHIHYQVIRDAINSYPDLRYMYHRSDPYGWRVVRYFAPFDMSDSQFLGASKAKVRRVGDGAKAWERWQL